MADEQKTVAAEEVAVSEAAPKKGGISEAKLEIIIAILLGVTAILTAWAGWIGSLHGGNQATNYATSNNLASDGNSIYNAAVQTLTQDMDSWNTIMDYEIEILYADAVNDQASVEAYVWKLQWFCQDNLPDDMAAMIGYDQEAFNDGVNDTDDILDWLYDESGAAVNSPFGNEEFVQSYFDEANAKLDEAQAVLEQGQQDNANGDKFSLVTVLYSVALFMLGIVGVFKNQTNKKIVLAVSVVCLLIAVIFMVTIPLPTSGGIFG